MDRPGKARTQARIPEKCGRLEFEKNSGEWDVITSQLQKPLAAGRRAFPVYATGIQARV
jgi:hypothetical protein